MSKAQLWTKLDGGPGQRTTLAWDEQPRLKKLMAEGYKIRSHGPGWIVVDKRLPNAPFLFSLGGKTQ